MLSEFVGATLRDFDVVKPGRWVRPTLSDGDYSVLEVVHTKGAGLSLRWGVSLSYLPRPLDGSSRPLRYHRTRKSATLDLFEFADQAIDGAVVFPAWRRPAAMLWSAQEFDALWEACEPRARRFWEQTRQPSEVLARADLQVDETAARLNFPAPAVVAAFCCARLSRSEEARSRLARLPEDRAALVAALQDTISRFTHAQP